jgi:predicted KAP-like P-loop ATPase
MSTGGPKSGEEASAVLLTTDRPINSSAQDRLGRHTFSKELAAAICQWRQNESLVVALYGAWGIGKSSIKNLVLEEIQSRNPVPVEALEFNPWQWHGHGEVSAVFFREVLTRLGQKDADAGTRKVIRTLRRYAAYLGLATAILNGPRGFFALVLAFLGLLTIGSPLILSQEHSITLLRVLGTGALALAAILVWGQTILERFATWRELALGGAKSLEDHKRDVTKALADYDRTLLVVIDDVDRLASKEIQSVFQLVKANADFPKFVYLLLFQRDIVESALSELANDQGGAFLEKIVQVGFDVPLARQDEVDRILFEGLDRVLGADRKRVDEVHWGNIYLGSLRMFFKDLRAVKRFLASLGFHINLLRTKGTLEVNPVDLIAVEALRVFDPDVYQRLRAAKGLLTGRTSSESSESKRVADELKALLDGVPASRKPAIQELLQELFPGTAVAFGGMRYSGASRAEWSRDLRVASEDFFDRYFEFALSKGDLSQSEVDMLFSLSSDSKGLRRELTRLSDEGRVSIALERLDTGKERIPLENAVPAITAIFDVGSLLPDPPPGAMFRPHWMVQRIAYQVLRREGDFDRREAILEGILRGTTSVSMAVFRTSNDTNAKERAKNPGGMLIREESVPKFQKIGREIIEKAAAEGRLAYERDLAHTLYRWRDWSSDGVVRGWVGNLVASPEGAIAFLRAFFHKSVSQTIGDRVGRTRGHLKYTELEQFADLAALDAQVSKIAEVKLGDEDRQLVEAFRKAFMRKKSGKAEGDFDLDDED